MRQCLVGALFGAAYSGVLGLLMWRGIALPSPLGTVIPVAVYAGVGWMAAAGAVTPKERLSRALLSGLGCAVAAWLVSLVVLAPALAEKAPGEILTALAAGLVAELKYAAVAGVVGRRRRPTAAPMPSK
ncbi:MAG TPA: hypothetical protein VD969_13185 [Symbiobacteriaceae bacterium]|nr:hypothetical protein [Symbiobacteriaceae bacterium]